MPLIVPYAGNMNHVENNKRVAVVGASSGIGRATAEMLARAGYDVLAIGRDETKLRTLSDTLSARRADASDPGAIAAAFASLRTFDHLVLAPSSSRGMGEFATLDFEEFRAGLDGKLWPFAIALQ